LIVNKGNESIPKETSNNRDLHAVEGFEHALKLAQVRLYFLMTMTWLRPRQANLEEVIRVNPPPDPEPPSSIQNPTTTSYVYLRIQPFISTITVPEKEPTESVQLQFILLLSDPTHKLSYTTVTQAIPEHWLKMWDEYEWVEDTAAETLRFGVEVVGQEYVIGRMGWGKREEATAATTEEDATTAAVADA
jgi:hypothetical protein